MEFLHSDKLSGDSKASSSQKHIDVEEIKDGVIVLKNGSLRGVLLVSSINFSLKSSEEQDSMVFQYQKLLNSIDFPLQIVVNSRKFNIDPYINLLMSLEKKQSNELLRLQTSEYMNFIKNLTEVSNVMTKNFYVVVPFAPIESEEKGFFGKLSSMFGSKQEITKKRELFETYKSQLWQRMDYVSAGIQGIGLKTVSLGTDELIELLYNSYNPSVFSSSIIEKTEEVELKI